MKCYEIIEKLETLSPPSYAEEWDNIGLLVGRRDKEVRRIYIALDATDDVIEDAIRVQADMLLTHHPMIFHKINRVNTDDFIGKRICHLIRSDMVYYAMHTNFDVKGMADAAAQRIGLQNAEVLDVTYDDGVTKEGCGQVPNVRVYGELDSPVRDAAIMPGSGGSFLQNALQADADVMITGDIDHHEAIDAMAQGISIIDAGHYGIEKLFIPYMEDYLKQNLPGIELHTAPFREPFTVC